MVAAARSLGRWFALPALLLALLPVLAYWWWQGRPVAIADAPQPRVPCLSYAPYQGSQTPFDATLVIPPQQIDADLAKLAGFTSCVRTYSTDQGLAEVPRLAAARGLQVMLGAWIGREREKNESELAAVIDLAQRYPETVAAVIVGNEVLLRREQPAGELAAMIRRVRDAAPVPVTYADVWEFWEQHPEVADAVDFVTIHTLPYWEDEPRPIAHAVPHVLAVWRAMAQEFHGKTVFIGEAGWPSAGRMREGALPSPLNQARFVRELMAVAAREQIGLNLIESFDQPWKRAMEGTVGGHWGVFDGDRRQKFPLTGPVSDDPLWLNRFAASAGCALILLSATVLAAGRRRLAAARWLTAAAIAAVAATLLVAGIGDGLDSARTVFDWVVFGLRSAIAAAAALLLLAALVAASPAPAPLSLAALLAAVRRGRRPDVPWRRAAWGVVNALTLFGAAATTLCLLFDPRYRDFAGALFAIPALALLASALLQRGASEQQGASPADDDRCQGWREDWREDWREERLLAWVLVPGGLAVAVNEGFANHQALAWTAVCLLLAASVLLRPRRAADQRGDQRDDQRGGGRSSASAASRTPAAAGSGT